MYFTSIILLLISHFSFTSLLLPLLFPNTTLISTSAAPFSAPNPTPILRHIYVLVSPPLLPDPNPSLQTPPLPFIHTHPFHLVLAHTHLYLTASTFPSFTPLTPLQGLATLHCTTPTYLHPHPSPFPSLHFARTYNDVMSSVAVKLAKSVGISKGGRKNHIILHSLSTWVPREADANETKELPAVFTTPPRPMTGADLRIF